MNKFVEVKAVDGKIVGDDGLIMPLADESEIDAFTVEYASRIVVRNTERADIRSDPVLKGRHKIELYRRDRGWIVVRLDNSGQMDVIKSADDVIRVLFKTSKARLPAWWVLTGDFLTT